MYIFRVNAPDRRSIMYNPAQTTLGLSIASLALCFFVLIYTLIQKHKDKLQNKFFIAIVVVLAANSITGILSGILDPYIGVSEQAYQAVLNNKYFYFVTHTALCPLFFYYVSCVTGTFFKGHKRRLFMSLPFFITETLVITNPLTHWCWHINEEHDFVRGWGEALIYVAALIYFVSAIVIFVRFWSVLSNKRKMAMVFFFTLVAVGVLIQLFFKHFRVEVLSEILGFTGVLMAVENEDDRIDMDLGYYNRAALAMDLKSTLRNRRPMHLLVLRITNADIIGKMSASENTKILSKNIGEHLETLTRRFYIYAPNPSTFAITLFDSTEEEAKQLAENILVRFTTPWELGNQSVMLKPVVLVADCPGRVITSDDALYMIDSPIPRSDKQLLIGEDLDYLLRRASVENAVSIGLEQGSFEVYYQPTYHLDQTLHGAEALLRMHDRYLGNLYPDEFIPVAEYLGLIDQIDDYVLREVCAFIATGIPVKHGMDSINVNLSVQQCMQAGFVDHINSIVEEYDVDKTFLNFEITESVGADDYQKLNDVIKDLRADGYQISMDDYGTGYSNMTAVFSLDLDVIKIDKSILWEAEKDNVGRIILESNVRMIHEMNKKILVAGVETKSQLRLLTELSVDYLQGFLFAKPIPKKDFVDLISR